VILGGSKQVSISNAICFVQHSGFISMVWTEDGREGGKEGRRSE